MDSGLCRTRDGEGLRRLQELCEHDPGVSAAAARQTVHRTALIVAAKGGTVGSVTPGDVLELLDAETRARAGSSGNTTVFYRLLHQMGVLGVQAPGQAAGIPHPWSAHARRTHRPVRAAVRPGP